jgi:hypothetical protein
MNQIDKPQRLLAVRTDLTEVSSTMLIKTLTLHSLTYLVGITSSVAMHQVIRSPIARLRVTGYQLSKQSLKLMTKDLYRCQHKSRQIRNSKPIVSRQLISLGAVLQTLK